MTVTKATLYLTGLLFGVLGLVAVSSQSEARTINVNCPKKSLQSAVNAARPGDTVNVSGACNEQVTVNTRGITLNGGGTAVLDGAGLGSRPGFRVQAINVVIIGFTIQNNASHAGVQVRRGGAAIIRSNTITGNLWGILVNQNGYAVIGSGSSVHDLAGAPGSQGNTINANLSVGIIIRQASSADIFHNSINNNVNHGIRLNELGTADIDGNQITGHTATATSAGISVSWNSSARLANDPNHGGDPVEGPEPNLINGNSVGVQCNSGGVVRGRPQDFTGGNTDDANVSGSCVASSSLALPLP